MREFLGGTKENNVLSNEGSLICPHLAFVLPSFDDYSIIFFYKKQTEKKIVGGQTYFFHGPMADDFWYFFLETLLFHTLL